MLKNKIFQNNPEINWSTEKGIMRIDNNRIVEIHPARSGYSYYDKFIVNVKHLINGNISSQAFYFDDYMDINKRIDSKRNLVYQGGYRLEKVGNDFKWCVAEPPRGEIDKLVTAIYYFIDNFRINVCIASNSPTIENLGRGELINLLYAYDTYIKDIVDDLPLHMIDRVPVTISEFYNNDYLENR